MMFKVIFVMVILLSGICHGDLLFREDFNSTNFLNGWTSTEVGDADMTWYNSSESLAVTNSKSSGGNNQSVIFSHPLATTGYKNIYCVITYKGRYSTFDKEDYIRVDGFSSSPPDYLSPIVEWSTVGEWTWNGGTGPYPPLSFTPVEVSFGDYSTNNPEFRFGIEVNTSQSVETLYIDSFEIYGTPIPEPATCLVLIVGGILLEKRKR